MTQNEMILRALLDGFTLTGAEAFSRFGTLKLATRCSELIRQGHPVQKRIITTASGKRVCEYWMLPQTQARAAA